MPERTYTLYVVKLHEDARERVLGSMTRGDRMRVDRRMPCVYVGYTSRSPAERLARHRAGGRTSSGVVREHGVGLLRSLTRGRRRMASEEEALAAEAALAEELRSRGYAVYGKHGDRLHLSRRGY